MKEKKGIKHPFSEPDEDKIIVSMLEFKGQVIIATKKGIYRLEGEKMIRLQFVDELSSSVPLQAPESPVSG